MTINEKCMLVLLSSALWENTRESDSLSKDNHNEVINVKDYAEIKNNCDWQEVYNECKIQSVLGIAADALPKEMDGEVRKVWSDTAKKQLLSFTNYEYQQTNLINLMAENGIKMAILKGSAAAVYYDNPSSRSMGDIDFIVKPSDFENAHKLMLDNGFTYAHDDEINERHLGFRKNGYIYELHKRFSYDDLDIEKYITEAFDKDAIETKEIMGYKFPSLPKLANGMVLLAHMRSHLKSGMGFRQIIDWNMYVSRELDDEFWEREFKEAAYEAGLEKLAKVASKLGRKYLGMPGKITWFEDVDETICDKLMENILSSGNFGRKHGEGNKFESVLVGIKREGLFKRLYHAGISNWRFARNHRWARPLAPIYQVGRYVCQSIKSARKSDVRKSLKRGSERYNLLKDLDIE